VGNGFSDPTESPENGFALTWMGCSKPYSRPVKRATMEGDKQMLALVTIFVATFLIAALAIWVYRLLFRWTHRNTAVVGRQRRSVMKLSAQQGYISLIPGFTKPANQPVRRVVLNKSKGGLKAPWGW